MQTRKTVSLTAEDLWLGKFEVGPEPDSLYYDSKFGIGLKPTSTEGWFVSGIFQIDCSPMVIEYGDVETEDAIYYGWSSVNWQVRSSADGEHWSAWFGTLRGAPVRQFIQFKFKLTRVSSLESF